MGRPCAYRPTPAAEQPFPLPVRVFGRDTTKVFAAALGRSMEFAANHTLVSSQADERSRQTLAHGVVLAATLGVRDERHLALRAVDHLSQVVDDYTPEAEQIPGLLTEPRKRYQERAAEVQAIADQTADPSTKRVLATVALDYERMARTMDRIRASRALLKELGVN